MEQNTDEVRDYLQQFFEGATVREERDIERGTIKFIIEYGKGTHTVTLAKAFVNSLEEGRIIAKLNQFLLVEHLQEMSNVRLVVTLNGLESEYEI